MKDWKRIILVVFIVIGGTMSFAFWSFQQFNNVFDSAFENLSASYIAISPRVRELPTTATTTPITATSTPTTSEASSTTSSDQDDIDPKFHLIFSPKGGDVYIGCTYEISWLTSTTTKSLETALIDTGTRKPIGPKASGLAKENNIKANSQSLKWKVGVVWPGAYYIKVSNINGVDLENYSKVFTISKMPKGISVDEREKICKQ